MSRRHRSMPRPLVVTALIVACCATAAALTGCSAGQITQTDNQVAAVDGAAGDAGNTIALRDVLIPFPPSPNGTYPAGSNVPVLLTIVNQSTRADELTAVTSPAASQVLVLGTRTIPPGSNVISTGGATPAGAQPLSPLVAGQLRIVLTTIQPLRGGLNTPVTFVFRDAGEVTVPVPMATSPDSTGEVPESGEEGGGHG